MIKHETRNRDRYDRDMISGDLSTLLDDNGEGHCVGSASVSARREEYPLNSEHYEIV